ncbi:MAG TPA: NAD(+) synthase [Thermoanaerobaculia bacterium]|nr:NAD(+) synthase [Thermoanaerobaculia bacterium]
MVDLPFQSPYRHGFVRVAVVAPRLHLANPAANAEETVRLARIATERGAALAVFPELGLSGYSADDLFHQQGLLGACREAVAAVLAASAGLGAVLIAGVPLLHEAKLFNCAVVLHRGRILGVVPKSYLPNYREYYEKRQFSRAAVALRPEIELAGQAAPFGAAVFRASTLPAFSFYAEVCEDLWVPVPPSSWGALAGATILCNLSASHAAVGKADYREVLCSSHSGRCVAAYLYAGAGFGESTTDLAWDNQAMIFENGVRLAAVERFSTASQIAFADVDVERLELDRMRMTSFQDSVGDHHERLRELRSVPFDFEPPEGELALERRIERFPYVPSDRARRDERCDEVYRIQVQGLAQRLDATGIERVVIGVSGGLDSTQALLVAVRTFDLLGRSRRDVLGYTLPGLATSARTLGNARELMRCLGVTAGEIDISEAALGMLRRIGHPFARGEEVYDVTFENVQAGERTSHLFRLANFHDALVVGTGDLSELALGWCTYGVGDQMSHYGVNASVPKTLIQHLIRWAIQSGRVDADTAAVLQSILDTAISPELVPGDGATGVPAQSTEDVVGPFDLQDFHLYYLTRFGFRPSKVAYLAHHAWGDAARGSWPEELPPEARRAYDLPAIERWLELFLRRFFEQSQYKRSAMPNAPKVGTGGSLSPRGDWRAPSDASAHAWIEELRRNLG